ncbi:MAG: 4'-phosphopantetheinyl transferase superfamily protein [Rhodobacteraceae bacterium]|nr:4'-phosphopantetheinyl transferase superfamily protein [Paracoccaceae bacterium]
MIGAGSEGGGVEIGVDLWLWPLEEGGDATILSAAEQARADRFVHLRDAVAYRAAHVRLRQILGGYVGCDPAALVFTESGNGKPELAQGPAFNLSHSGGWAALAVTPAPRLGVDIEAHRTVEPEVAERFFSRAEQHDLAPLAGVAWRDAFFRCWTRKEAFVKAVGAGLSLPLDSFDVTILPGDAPCIRRLAGGRAEDWTLIDLPLGAGFAGAVVVEAKGQPVHLTLRAGRMPLPGH